MTKSEKTRIGKAIREITEALDETDKERIGKHIEARARRYRETWPQAELTPEALVKHWSRFAPARGRPSGAVSADRLLDEKRLDDMTEDEWRVVWPKLSSDDRNFVEQVRRERARLAAG